MSKLLLSSAKTLSAALAIVLLLSGCMKDKITRTYTILTPVYKSKAEVFANIKSNPGRQVEAPGKIYLYGSYIFLNEVNKGVHIIDNSEPTNPKNIAFIDIPGNIDIAVRGNTLYADFFTDLLAIDITNPLQSKVTKVLPHIFPERQYGSGFWVDSTKVIVDWIKKDTTVEAVADRGGNVTWECRNCVLFSDASNSSKAGASVPGIAGSMSRFAIVGNYLYTVNQYSLGVQDITTPTDPVNRGVAQIGMNIETIYPFKEKLFIGSSGGMFIYDISNPSLPAPQGSFNHARACDPVVADDDYAFVTLRSGTFCQGTNNQLDVINVKNVMSPSLVKTYSMSNPHGLAKDGNLLFVCDGKAGLKLYETSNVSNLKLIRTIPGMDAFDVIAWDKKLLLVASNGLYQFDYSNRDDIRLISTIAINRK